MNPQASQPFRVLLVEDHPGDARRVKDLLEWKGGNSAHPFKLVYWVKRLDEALAFIGGESRGPGKHSEPVGEDAASAEAEALDLVLLDLTLPDGAGLDVFAQLNAAAPHLAVIVMAELDDESTASAIVQAGAQEFMIKSEMAPRSLQRTMRHAIDRKKIERDLEHKTEFLNAMLTSSPDRIYFKDSNSRFLQINQTLADWFGTDTPADVIGKSDFDFFPPDRAAVKFDDERRIMATGQPILNKVEQETMLNGSSVWLLTTKMPLRDRKGRIIGTFGASRDITALKDMEEALQRERNLLRSVIDNVPDLIQAKDTLGRYILNNLAHTHHLNEQTPSDMLGKTVFDYFPPELAAQYYTDDMEVLASGMPIIGKVEPTLNTGGKQRWISTTKVPIFDENGEAMGIATVSRDVTAEKLAREESERANSNLVRSQEELMKALEQLRAVQLELIEAEKMKLVGRLAAGVAHEVKNPLAIIRMGTEYMIRQQFDDPNIPTIVHEIQEAVERADNVVCGLLDFSAPKKLNMTPCDLNHVIRHALILVRGELGSSKFRVVEEFQHDLPKVRLDAPKIEQVFVNVLTNAAHAMEGGGTLTVRTYLRQVTGVGENIAGSGAFRPGDRVVVAEVMDSGHGVPEAMIGRLFEPFFSTKPTGKGTGLGLTVTRTIVDLHGGTINIRNRPEGGACVTVTLRADDPL